MYVELRTFAMGLRNNNGHKGFFFLLMHGGWLQKIMKSTVI
jgi:hypothetical protein